MIKSIESHVSEVIKTKQLLLLSAELWQLKSIRLTAFDENVFDEMYENLMTKLNKCFMKKCIL